MLEKETEKVDKKEQPSLAKGYVMFIPNRNAMKKKYIQAGKNNPVKFVVGKGVALPNVDASKLEKSGCGKIKK